MNIKTIRTITHAIKPLGNVMHMRFHPQEGQRVILMYHGISQRPHFNCITANFFEEQLAWLKENYLVIPLSMLIEKLKSPSLNPLKLAAITFDDGYSNFAELALPILQKYNYHATVFVPAGKVGYYNDWDKGIDSFYKMEIMSYKILQQLPEEFVEIGSHGISHVPFDRLTFSELEREVVESRLEIEQNITRQVRFFAFPLWAYPFKHKGRLHDNKGHFLGGYKAACTSWWGRYNSIKDVNMLRRVGIWDSDSFQDFIDKLNGYYDWLEKKEKVGRSLKMMKSCL